MGNFLKIYDSKNNDELIGIVHSTDFTPEARNDALKILQERGVGESIIRQIKKRIDNEITYETTAFGDGKVSGTIYALAAYMSFYVCREPESVYYFLTNGSSLPSAIFPSIIFSIMISLTLTAIILSMAHLIGRHFGENHIRNNQTKRDLRANHILHQAKNGDVGDFTLYLRAFETSGRMPQKEDDQTPSRNVLFFRIRPKIHCTTDFEAAIANAVEFDAPLVALGGPAIKQGGGRVLTGDKEWKSDLETLANKAFLIFVIPMTSTGIEWEIDYIHKNNFFEKTIFILPPGLSEDSFPNRDSTTFSFSKKWLKIRCRMKEMKIELPSYNKKGLLFNLKEDGKPSIIEEIEEPNPKILKRKIKSVFNCISRNQVKEKPPVD